jgi:hypothetical protein
MKNIGLLLLFAGCLMMLFQGINFMATEKVIDLGNIEITHTKSHPFEWSPVIGLAMIFMGGGLYLFGSKKMKRA